MHVGMLCGFECRELTQLMTSHLALLVCRTSPAWALLSFVCSVAHDGGDLMKDDCFLSRQLDTPT